MITSLLRQKPSRTPRTASGITCKLFRVTFKAPRCFPILTPQVVSSLRQPAWAPALAAICHPNWMCCPRQRGGRLSRPHLQRLAHFVPAPGSPHSILPSQALAELLCAARPGLRTFEPSPRCCGCRDLRQMVSPQKLQPLRGSTRPDRVEDGLAGGEDPRPRGFRPGWYYQLPTAWPPSAGRGGARGAWTSERTRRAVPRPGPEGAPLGGVASSSAGILPASAAGSGRAGVAGGLPPVGAAMVRWRWGPEEPTERGLRGRAGGAQARLSCAPSLREAGVSSNTSELLAARAGQRDTLDRGARWTEAHTGQRDTLDRGAHWTEALAGQRHVGHGRGGRASAQLGSALRPGPRGAHAGRGTWDG